jgi:PAS domain S-box-containing protein
MTQKLFTPAMARFISVVTILTSVIVLCGWIFNIPLFRTFIPGGPEMKINSAICFILCGIVLFILARERTEKNYLAIFLAGLTGFISLITLAEYVTGIDTGINKLPGYSMRAMKMSPETSSCFLILSCIFFLSTTKKFYNLRHLLALTIMSIALFEITEHLFGVHKSPEYYAYSSTAFPSCALFLLIGNSILTLNPDKGITGIVTGKNAAGKVGRTILPFAVFFPLAIGWMIVKGGAEWYNLQYGLTLFTITNIVILSSVILVSAKYYSSLEKKQSETVRQAEKKEKLFQALTENNSDAILLSDKNFKIIYSSPSTGRLTGRTADERENTDWIDRIHPDDIQTVKKLCKEVLEHPGKQFNILVRNLHKEGHYIWLEGIITNMLHDPSIEAIVYNLRDVTERMESRKKLREANSLLKQKEARLKEAQAIAQMGNWEINFKTGKCTWSEEVYRMYNINHGDIEPSVDAFLSFINEEDAVDIRKAIKEASKTFENTTFNFRFTPATGGVRHAYSESRFEFDANGKPVRLFGIIQDVTERKLAEENLRAVNKELETFIYKATHDLRGPLASIIGTITLGEKEIEDSEVKLLFDMIGVSARKLDNTLVGLVQSMNIKDTKIFDQKIDFGEITDETLKKFLNYKGYSRLNISRNISGPAFLYSNRPIMESIFQNMVENAIKYQDYNKEESHLTIDISENQSEIRLLFQDNGIGIASSMHDRIFDMYYRGTTESKGSGLGLYLVKTGVDKLKGRIEVESQVKNGTAFSIYLPKQLAKAS